MIKIILLFFFLYTVEPQLSVGGLIVQRINRARPPAVSPRGLLREITSNKSAYELGLLEHKLRRNSTAEPLYYRFSECLAAIWRLYIQSFRGNNHRSNNLHSKWVTGT